MTPTTTELLERLIAFDTVSSRPNAALIDWAADLLRRAGARVQVISAEGGKANLYASVGPAGAGGVMLSGHTDVVPVDGQAWSKPPFRLTREGGRLYGRGTADMKGFVASALRLMLIAARRPMAQPLHLALSHDEEVGCLGVRSLIDLLAQAPERPAFCIVGEPTGLQVATGHKGKQALTAHVTGREGHSALAPLALNALHLGAEFIGALREVQARLAREGAQDGDYDVSYSTVHAGKMSGGVQVNIVPNSCRIDFEIRHLAQDDLETLIAEIEHHAAQIAGKYQEEFPEANIAIERGFSYPGLLTPPGAEVVRFVQSLTGANGTIKVAFGTEGGLFMRDLAIPTVICGPGSMAQGHKPDEFVSEEQLALCDRMLERLADRLT